MRTPPTWWREPARTALQELIEAEATDVIGAGRYERRDARTNERDGARPADPADDIDLRIPNQRRRG